jgi:hypothetical protein
MATVQAARYRQLRFRRREEDLCAMQVYRSATGTRAAYQLTGWRYADQSKPGLIHRKAIRHKAPAVALDNDAGFADARNPVEG